jgi:hypothetical protein
VGAFAFAPFIQYLLSIMDWKSVMIILGGILLQCCLMGALLRPAPRQSVKKLLLVAKQTLSLFCYLPYGSFFLIKP